MAVLDNAIWLTAADGTAEGGSVVINDGGNSTTVTSSFTPNAWDASQNTYAVSEFGAFGLTTPITANYTFSDPIETLSFDFQHVSASGTTFDDLFVLRIYDDLGNLVPASTVIAGLSGMTHTNVYANPDGSVSIEADGTAADTISVSLAGPISEIDIEFGPGPDGTQSGGAGIGDFTFSVPAMVCFARDTEIETKTGCKLIQDLAVGDEILTRDNGYQAIRWIGSKAVSGAGALAPIVITAGTMDNDRDLIVSPQHRIVVGGWQSELLFGEAEHLVVAKHLVNGDTIYRAENRPVEYFHMLFDQHEIIYANGIATESFHPNAGGLSAIASENREEIFALFPELRDNVLSYGPSVLPTLKKHEVEVLRAA